MKKRIITECWNRSCAELETHPMWDHPCKPRFFHYSYLVQSNRIVSDGVNHFGIVPPGYPPNSLTHSEVHAVARGKSLLDLSKPFEILNFRIGKDGKMRMSKPCIHCYRMLDALGCSRAYFSTDLGVARLDF